MPVEGHAPERYIRTPAELDAAARILDRALGLTPSPQKRFLLLTEFWANTRNIPPAWVSSYLLPLAPLYTELLRVPALSNVPPREWRSACAFLQEIHQQNWLSGELLTEQVFERAIEHAIRSHAYVSALRELHQFLLELEWIAHPLSLQDWTNVFAASTSAFGLFRAYVAVLEEHGGKHVPLFRAILKQWQQFRERGNAVSVVLLEADGDGRHAAGRVQLMDILPQEGVKGESVVNNLLGDQGYETVEQLDRARSVAESLVEAHFRVHAPRLRYHFSLHETSAALVGGSLGCAAAAGLAAGLTQRLNRSERWKLPTTVGCIGSLAADGALEAGRWDAIEKKLRVAFCSPLEKIVIPAVYRETALLTLQLLQREYPNRQLEVIGINRVQDIIGIESAFLVTQRPTAVRLREFVTRHGISFLLLLVLLLVGGGGYFAYQAQYGYPNLEQALGLTVGPSSIVYNPRDSLEWCFRDGRRVFPAVVGFGDIEVGDGFTRSFRIWNMTPSTISLRLSIEGPDSAEWYINSGEQLLDIPETHDAGITLMYAPLREGVGKEAALVLREPDTGRERFRLRLEGSAGPPLPAGYALYFDGIDDELHFGKRSTAFDLTSTASNEATFECWIRPASPLVNAMILHNGQSYGQSADIEDLFFGFVSPDTLYYRVGSAMNMYVLAGRQVATMGEWMHLALAVSMPQRRIAVYVNGEVIDDRHVDFLFDGPGTPFVTVGARNTGTASDLHFHGEIDELRLWHRFRSATEIRAGMRRRPPGLAEGLAGYWDMDAAVENTVFNANKLAHSGSLLHRPLLRRSTLPLPPDGADCSLVGEQEDGVALQLRPGRYLVTARSPLERYGDASFAFRFLQTAEPAIHFNYVLKERGWISVENNMLFTLTRKLHYDIPEGWHAGVCLVTAEGRLRFYLDGELLVESETIADGIQDWHARFEGLMLGFRFDKEQQLASKYYDWYHPTLSHPRSYGSLHVWNRLLDDAEIRAWSLRAIVPTRGLTASWRFTRLPDVDGNIADEVGGLLLHVKRVRSWE